MQHCKLASNVTRSGKRLGRPWLYAITHTLRPYTLRRYSDPVHFGPYRDAEAAYRQLRRLGIDQGKTVQRMAEEAFNDYFAKHGLPEIAGAAGS